MSEYQATIRWTRNHAPFTDGKYSRAHTWDFDGGVRVPASASPLIVPLPLSVAEAVDPEEAFVASLSSCHMLWFLAIAAKRGFVVEDYHDAATGSTSRDNDGKLAITRVVLRPQVIFAGARHPSVDEHTSMHHDAHDQCFIARSVKTDVVCEATDVTPVRA